MQGSAHKREKERARQRSATHVEETTWPNTATPQQEGGAKVREKGPNGSKGTATNAGSTVTEEQNAGAKEKAKETKKENPPGAVNKQKTNMSGKSKEKNGAAEAKKLAARSKTFVKSALKMTTLARSPSTQEPQFL